MAKSGLDYFPLAVNFKDNVLLIEAEFGLRGLAIIVKLYQKIYGGFGYYCEWNDEVALLFSRKACGLSEGDNVVSEVIKAAFKRELLSESMFHEYGILTSTGIQKRYFEAAKRRNDVEVIKEYLLLDVSKISKNAYISSKNVCRNQKNVCRNQQSKGKERKVNKDICRFAPPTHEEVAQYCKERNNKIDADQFIDFYTSKNWMVGKTKMSDWKAAVRTWERRKEESAAVPKSKQNNFNNYPQRDYTHEEMDALEKELLGIKQ